VFVFSPTKLWTSINSPSAGPPGFGWLYASNRAGNFVSLSTYSTHRYAYRCGCGRSANTSYRVTGRPANL
jgi:hypothetical protein